MVAGRQPDAARTAEGSSQKVSKEQSAVITTAEPVMELFEIPEMLAAMEISLFFV